MTYTVIGFQKKIDLQKYLTANVADPTKITAIYYDSSSGEHVVVFHT